MSRVLVVDDEPDILLMLRISLENRGHEVVLAADGEQALARIGETDPDIVLLDVMMPVLDGWGVLEQLQQGPGPPVVIVSARSGERDVQRAMSLGAVDYLVKPFSPDALVDRIDAILDDVGAG